MKNTQTKTIRLELRKSSKKIDSALHHVSYLYIPKLIQTKLTCRHHNDRLKGHSDIEKIGKLIAQKYYWKILRYKLKTYIKMCDIYLALKAVRHKPYQNRQFLLIITYCWEDISTDFVTSLPILTNKKK